MCNCWKRGVSSNGRGAYNCAVCGADMTLAEILAEDIDIDEATELFEAGKTGNLLPLAN